MPCGKETLRTLKKNCLLNKISIPKSLYVRLLVTCSKTSEQLYFNTSPVLMAIFFMLNIDLSVGRVVKQY